MASNYMVLVERSWYKHPQALFFESLRDVADYIDKAKSSGDYVELYERHVNRSGGRVLSFEYRRIDDNEI